MASSLIDQHQITTFSTPVNGTTPIDANQVRGNDNTIKTSYNAHDADPTIHLQDSSLGAMPAAGVVGRKWMTNDQYRIYYDDGAAWHEMSYLGKSGDSTLTGTYITSGRWVAAADISGAIAYLTASDGNALSGTDIAVASILGSLTSVVNANTSSSWVAEGTSVQQSVATTGTTYSQHVFAGAGNTSGTVAALKGVGVVAAATGSGGTVTTMIGFEANCVVGTGATVSEYDAIRILAPSGAGTLTAVRGINIGNLGASNFAIITGTGIVQYGDIMILAATTSSRASLRIPNGTSPSSPTNGDMWYDGVNVKFQIGGTTKIFTLT